MTPSGSNSPRAQRSEGRERIFDAAVKRYVSGESIDLSTLAAESGVSRASAYRWFGDNDRLLAEVLLHRADANFERASERHASKQGRERVIATLSDFLHHASESEGTRVLLDRNPQRAMSIIASRAYPNQRAVIENVEGLLEEEVKRGMQLPVDVRSLAYIIVRVIESFIYADVIAEEEPNPERAVDMIRLLVAPGGGDQQGLQSQLSRLHDSVDEVKQQLDRLSREI